MIDTFSIPKWIWPTNVCGSLIMRYCFPLSTQETLTWASGTRGQWGRIMTTITWAKPCYCTRWGTLLCPGHDDISCCTRSLTEVIRCGGELLWTPWDTTGVQRYDTAKISVVFFIRFSCQSTFYLWFGETCDKQLDGRIVDVWFFPGGPCPIGRTFKSRNSLPNSGSFCENIVWEYFVLMWPRAVNEILKSSN